MYVEAQEYVVVARVQETPTTTTLSLKKADGSIPDYIPGQCLTVYFPDLSQTLGKQYSISSAPYEKTCAITVKAIGRFSNRLCSLSVGDHILGSNPNGTFYPKQLSDLILLAGGMGVTPFRSIILESLFRASAVKIRLLYSTKTAADMPFGVELYHLTRHHPSLSIERFVTRESGASSGLKYRRMRTDDMVNQDNFKESEYLISGSLNFVLDLKNTLIGAGVSREHILTEAYF
jgi:ferredoxin-NADP reductase